MKVAIDAGHGGSDPGAIGRYGLYEKDINLMIAQKLKVLLEKQGIEVVMTRTDDSFISLDQRCRTANTHQVNLFVSIHVNASGSGDAAGVEIHVLGLGGQAEVCANKILPHLTRGGSFNNRGIKVSNFQVLRDTAMPAILTENGFIDNIGDAKQLTNSVVLQAIAEAHAKGICEYFDIGTLILGRESVTIEQCQQLLLKNNPNASKSIIPHYKRYGELLGIAWGKAVAQMFKETNYLTYKKPDGSPANVKPEQLNFAGLGAVGEGVCGASFTSEAEGVLAHLEHLFAYACTANLPSDLKLVDPRWIKVTRGIAPCWENLNGRWAVPGENYGQQVIVIYNKICAEVVIPTVDKTSQVITMLNDVIRILKG